MEPDEAEIRHLAARETGPKKPGVVLLGDSMLETRIDEQVLRETAGIKFEKMAYPGSGSASWWLILKNYIAPQTYPPRTIVIFFRNMQLTLADYHTHGRFSAPAGGPDERHWRAFPGRDSPLDAE